MSTNIANPSNTLAKVRWQEPYVSEGLNKKLNGPVPAGILRGGRLSTNPANLSVTVEADDKTGDSVYSYIDANGHQITFRQTGDITLDLTAIAGTTVYLALYVSYSTLANTVVYWRSYSEAELYGGAPVPEAAYVVVLGRVVVPAAGLIPAANITPLHRIEAWRNTSRCAREWHEVIGVGAFEMAEAIAYTGTEEVWPGWDELSGLTAFAGVNALVSTAQARSGTKSFYIQLTGNPVETASLRWAGRTAVSAGQLVDASVWVMGVLVAPGPALAGHLGLRVVFYDAAGGFVAEEYVEDLTLVGSFAWTEISAVFAAPTGSAWFDVYVVYDDVGNSSTGDYYFDDVRVWVEAGDAHDPFHSFGERDPVLRADAHDVPPPPSVLDVASMIQQTLRLRQDASVLGVLQAFLGARGVKSVYPFNLLLQNGAIEIQRIITRIGSGLLASAANAVIPRVTADISDPAVGQNTLLAYLPQTDATKQPVRLYASGSSGVTGGEHVFLTFNAVWSSALGTWTRDIAGESILVGVRLDGFHVYWYPAAGASPWANAAWQSGPPSGEIVLNLFRNAGGKAEAYVEDFILRWTRTTAVSNPAALAATTSNSLYAKNICKVWGKVTTDGIGGIVLNDGFGISAVGFNGQNARITFTNNFANTNYVAIPAVFSGGFGAFDDQVHHDAAAVGSSDFMYVRAGVQRNLAGAAHSFSFAIFGEQ